MPIIFLIRVEETIIKLLSIKMQPEEIFFWQKAPQLLAMIDNVKEELWSLL